MKLSNYKNEWPDSVKHLYTATVLAKSNHEYTKEQSLYIA